MQNQTTDDTSFHRYTQLKAEADTLFAKAKDEALSKARQAIAELNGLGFTYDIIDTDKKSKTAKTKRQAKAGACPICTFETSPYHNGRQHRAQGHDKRPFTADELAELGLSKAS